MEKQTKSFSISMSQIELFSLDRTSSKAYPLMDVKIFDSPGLLDIIDLMNSIKKAAKEINEDYISVTDLSKLNINKFFGKIILSGMESTYKSILWVGKPAIMLFVILGENQEYRSLLNNTLLKINEENSNTSKDYKYKYYFVTSGQEIGRIAEQILLN